LLMLGPQRIFQEEEMEWLQLLRQPGRLDGREPLMDVMEKLDLITHLISKVGEHPRDDPKVAGRLPVRLNCRNWTSVSPSRCGCLSCTANAIRPACSRHRALHTDHLEPLFLQFAYALVDLRKLPAAGVAVGE